MVEGVQVAVDLDDGPLEEVVVWACGEGKERLVERCSNELGLLRPEEIEAEQLREVWGATVPAEDFQMKFDIVNMLIVVDVVEGFCLDVVESSCRRWHSFEIQTEVACDRIHVIKCTDEAERSWLPFTPESLPFTYNLNVFV
jgi:hypothetical protein